MNNNEPVILGKVKKGGSGKPIVVIIMLLFIGSLILLLPTIKDYFGDENIIELTTNGQLIDFFINHDSYVKKSIASEKKEDNNTETINYINEKTIIKESNFTLSNFKLTKKDIEFKINVNSPINFDNERYYLILKKGSTELAVIKLVGNIKGNSIINYTFKKELDSLLQVIGNVKKYNDTDYPKFTLSSDESGLASLFCEYNNDNYEYIFDNNKLIRIKEEYNYQDSNEDYLDVFETYTNITKDINKSITNEDEQTNISASIEENVDGFLFKSDIDLNVYKDKINSNYYSYNINSNIVKYDMEAKGYDCK